MQNPLMSKFSAYLGLCLALLLAFIFLYPQKGYLVKPTHITPVDNDAISILIRQSSSSFKLLFRAEGFKNSCLLQPSTYDDDVCDFRNVAPGLSDLIEMQHDFATHIPNFSTDLELAIHRGTDDAKIRSLQEKVVRVYPAALAGYRSEFIAFTVTAHALFLLLLIALAYWRRQVGSFLISLVTVPLRMLFKGATAAHRKI